MRAPHHQYTWKQYTTLADDNPGKLEYFDGEIYAMAGGTPQHAALAAAVTAQFSAQLEGKPCRVYSSDLRVRVSATGLATYPDVSVVCGKLELGPNDKKTAVNPSVLVEVLSDSTEAYDRGAKREHYQQIESLRELVLVSHREELIEVYRRGEGAAWSRVEARTKSQVLLQSINCALVVDRVYAGIELHQDG